MTRVVAAALALTLTAAAGGPETVLRGPARTTPGRAVPLVTTAIIDIGRALTTTR